MENELLKKSEFPDLRPREFIEEMSRKTRRLDQDQNPLLGMISC